MGWEQDVGIDIGRGCNSIGRTGRIERADDNSLDRGHTGASSCTSVKKPRTMMNMHLVGMVKAKFPSAISPPWAAGTMR
ncbi:hypothetical protein [Nakamurella sp.]|uniref:hypothetical protein n=1 Tax=Nakamurella sp. TaxID=1869182 RepID=UPI00378511FB